MQRLEGELKDTGALSNITEELTYNTQGKLIEKINYEYKYDEKGNWIERLEFNLDIPQIITTRKIHYFD